MKLSLFSNTFHGTNVVQTSSRTLQVTPCPFPAQFHVASVESCPLKLKQPTNEILVWFQSSNRSSWKVFSLGKFTLWIWEKIQMFKTTKNKWRSRSPTSQQFLPWRHSHPTQVVEWVFLEFCENIRFLANARGKKSMEWNFRPNRVCPWKDTIAERVWQKIQLKFVAKIPGSFAFRIALSGKPTNEILQTRLKRFSNGKVLGKNTFGESKVKSISLFTCLDWRQQGEVFFPWDIGEDILQKFSFWSEKQSSLVCLLLTTSDCPRYLTQQLINTHSRHTKVFSKNLHNSCKDVQLSWRKVVVDRKKPINKFMRNIRKSPGEKQHNDGGFSSNTKLTLISVLLETERTFDKLPFPFSIWWRKRFDIN